RRDAQQAAEPVRGVHDASESGAAALGPRRDARLGLHAARTAVLQRQQHHQRHDVHRLGTLVRHRSLAVPYLLWLSLAGLCELLSRARARGAAPALSKAEPVWP